MPDVSITLSAAETLHTAAGDHSHMTCYLAGYVVECSGKEILIKAYGASLKDVKTLGHHLKGLSDWVDLILYSQGSNIPPGHFAQDAPTIFSGQYKWDPFKRYDSNCGWDQQRSTLYLAEARLTMQHLASLRASGLI
jgi:hypothetical protein